MLIVSLTLVRPAHAQLPPRPDYCSAVGCRVIQLVSLSACMEKVEEGPKRRDCFKCVSAAWAVCIAAKTGEEKTAAVAAAAACVAAAMKK